MTRYLISAAAVVLLYASPVLAADTMKPSSPPGGANAAGSDTSSGAKEQSSAPPGSPAESDLSNKSSTGARAIPLRVPKNRVPHLRGQPPQLDSLLSPRTTLPVRHPAR